LMKAETRTLVSTTATTGTAQLPYRFDFFGYDGLQLFRGQV